MITVYFEDLHEFRFQCQDPADTDRRQPVLIARLSCGPTPEVGGAAVEKQRHDSDNWVRAKRCSHSTCVEIRRSTSRTWIRDSKQNETAGQPILAVTYHEFDSFREEVLRQSLAGQTADLAWGRSRDDGGMRLSSKRLGTSLRFSLKEWHAFLRGLASGDF